MKKWLLMVVAAVFCAWNVQAQTEKGAMAAGVNLTVGFGDSYTNVGLGAKYQYNIIDNLRLEPNFNYYFKKTSFTADHGPSCFPFKACNFTS